MLNRAAVPLFQPIEKLSIHEPDVFDNNNGLKSFVFQATELELIKFEFVFKNHFDPTSTPLLNTALSALFKEGTLHRTSAQIAEEIDFYGAYLMPEYSFDYTSLTLYTMHKYVKNVLPIVFDILNCSTFPQKELDTYIRNNKQSLAISLKKNDFVARRLFYKNIFDENRYGYVPDADAFDAIHRDDLLALYRKQIHPSNCTLFIAGNVSNDVLQAVETLFASQWSNIGSIVAPADNISIAPVSSIFVADEKIDSLQSAIRLGQLSINRTHPDFPAVQFVNTLFGGFFGSRLMRNIREEKGYTYSIGSAVVSLKHTGFLTIASEVGVDVTQLTLKEIEKESYILRNELADDEEISLVRNYMQGVLLGSLESIFSHADKFKAVYFSEMDLGYYDYYKNEITSIDAERVRKIAQEYFNYENFVKVVVGIIK